MYDLSKTLHVGFGQYNMSDLFIKLLRSQNTFTMNEVK